MSHLMHFVVAVSMLHVASGFTTVAPGVNMRVAAPGVDMHVVRHCTKRENRVVAPPVCWAGENLRKDKGFFRSSAIPAGVAPWQFYLGLLILFVSNFGVAVIAAAERINPGSTPPVNAFTDIANAAMVDVVERGEVPAMMATFWSQRLWANLIGEYLQAGQTPEQFVSQWCESEPTRTAWCLTAKAVAEARMAAGGP